MTLQMTLRETLHSSSSSSIFFKEERCARYNNLVRLRHGDCGQACEEGVTTPTTAWRALQWRVRQATYRLTTQESATTIGQTTV